MAVVSHSFTAWLAPAVEATGYGRAYAGAVLTVFSLVQAPAALLVPLLADRYRARLPLLVGCSLLECLGFLGRLALRAAVWPSAVLPGLGSGGLFPLGFVAASHNRDASGRFGIVDLRTYIR
jgi:CP family cyanate transporter-like MFS transporter